MTTSSEHNRVVVDQHTQQAGEYARMTRSAGPDRPESFFEFLGVTREDRVLDVACGPGILTLDLAERAAAATGLDLTAAMLDQAREAQAERGVENVTWVQGDAAALPFPDKAFTLITCSAAFHHFEAPAAVLGEMARVCAPGGRVAVMDVTPTASQAEAYDRLERMRDPSHGHAHSLEELSAMGRQVGLGEPRSSTYDAGPFPFAALLETSFPEAHTREELLAMLREDAASGEDRLGFKATLGNAGEVLVSYPMSEVVWVNG